MRVEYQTQRAEQGIQPINARPHVLHRLVDGSRDGYSEIVVSVGRHWMSIDGYHHNLSPDLRAIPLERGEKVTLVQE